LFKRQVAVIFNSKSSSFPPATEDFLSLWSAIAAHAASIAETGFSSSADAVRQFRPDVILAAVNALLTNRVGD
jgi:hypothetical protein